MPELPPILDRGGRVLRQAGLCSNLVRGLAAFDPYIMVKRPTEVALRHFDLLYRTFQLRSWVSSANDRPVVFPSEVGILLSPH